MSLEKFPEPPNHWPGDFLLRPVPISAAVLLVINDHFLKGSRWLPGWLTGKLSDVAGLGLLPLLTIAVIELGFHVRNRNKLAQPSWFVLAALLIGAGFTLVKVAVPVRDAYSISLGTIRWIVRAPASWITRHPINDWSRVDVALDASDLLALAVLPITARTGILTRRTKSSS